MRTVWGTMRPTKPIPPATDTITPVSSAQSTNSCLRNRPRSMPSVAAVSSPTRSAFSERAWSRSRAVPHVTATAGRPSWYQRAPPRLPSSQNSTAWATPLSLALRAMKTRKLVSADIV